MKRLLIPLLVLLSFAAVAQTPFTPQFKRKIPNDSIAIVGIGSTNLSFKLPDTSWVKKYTSTYFVHGFLNGTGIFSDPFGIAPGYITPAMLYSISGVPGSGTVYYGDGHWGAISASTAWGAITGTLSDQTDLQSALNGKQATLVSATNIKTINSASLLGSGNILLQTPLVANTDYLTPTGSAAGLTGLLSSQVTGALGFTPVPNTRNVNTGPGLTGGGALSSDLTLKPDTTILATKYYASTVVGSDGILTGLVTTTVTTTATTTAGTYRLNNLLVVKGSSTNTTIPAQDATRNGYVLIVGDASGVFSTVVGTLALDAVEPDIPSNKALIASIYIPAVGGTVTTTPGGNGNNKTWVSKVSSANADILVANQTTTPILTLNKVNGFAISFYDPTSSIQTQLNSKLSTTTASTTYALQSTTVSPGLGLSGGGSLAANRTISADTTVLKSKAGFLTDYNNLSTRINAKGVGSVTSVAAGTGMSFTTITGSGTVNADTTVLRTVANSKTLAQEQTALNLKANLASPALTGTPTAPTATVGTNTTQIATTAFVLANSSSGGLTSTNFVFNEAPTGTINGSNPTFNSANTPTTGTIRVYLNGLRQTLTTDYTVSGSTITFVTAPLTGDVVIIDYLK